MPFWPNVSTSLLLLVEMLICQGRTAVSCKITTSLSMSSIILVRVLEMRHLDGNVVDTRTERKLREIDFQETLLSGPVQTTQPREMFYSCNLFIDLLNSNYEISAYVPTPLHPTSTPKMTVAKVPKIWDALWPVTKFQPEVSWNACFL